MIKRNIKKTVKEFDADGHIVRTTFTETTEEDDQCQPTVDLPYGWWNGPIYTGNPPQQPAEITCATPRQAPDITVTY